MSSLRKPATDKLKRDYNALSLLCQKQCQSTYRKKRGPLTQMDGGQEEGCVKDIIGSEDTFRTSMEDEKYSKLVEFILRVTPIEPHQNYLHFWVFLNTQQQNINFISIRQTDFH